MTAPGGSALVSLRERRTQVIALLSQAFARDVFEVDELERRMEVAQRAITVAELDSLVADVDPSARPLPAVQRLDPSGAERPDQQHLLAAFGGVDRRGRWIVPRKLSVFCVMGGASLDFREADLGPGVSEISVVCMAGGVEILVPPNVAVDLAANAILGGFDQSHRGLDALGTEPVATLRITGLAIAGGVSVETRRPGESARDAKRRIKEEEARLPLPSAARAALPPAVVVSPDRKKS